MLNANERWVVFYDAKLKTVPEKGPHISMRENIEEILPKVTSGEAVWLFEKNSAALRIEHAKIIDEHNIAAFQIHFADQKVSDPVFSDLASGSLRSEPKLDGEGIALSAHILISLEPNSKLDDFYLTILEDVPGVGRTKLRPFITSLFRQYTDFTFSGEKNAELKCRSIIDFVGHASAKLSEDLSNGYLSSIELTSFAQDKGLDESGKLIAVSNKLKLKVIEKLQSDEAVGLINEVKKKALAKKYGQMRVTYKKPEGKQKSIEFGTAREDAGEVLSLRSEQIHTSVPLAQCNSGIRPDVVRQMASLLLKERDGIDVAPDDVNLEGPSFKFTPPQDSGVDSNDGPPVIATAN